MQAKDLIPSPDAIPVHWGWLQLLLLLTFVLHLLFMNALLGSTMLAFWARIRRSGDGTTPVAVRKLPFLVAFTVNTGVAPLLFVQGLYGHLFYTSSIMMACWWLSIIGLLILLYYTIYICCIRAKVLKGGMTLLLGFALLCMLAAAFFLTTNSTLMLDPERWRGWFANASGTMLNLADPTLLPRYFHFLMASLAVGGLTLAVVSRRGERRGEEQARARTRRGMQVFAWATLVQGGIGIWFLLALPRPVMLIFMGDNILATVLFLAGLGLFGLLLHLGFSGKLYPALVTLIATVAVMAGMRELVRQAYLQGLFHPADLEKVSQYGPMILFFITLAIGLAALVYMARLAREATQEA